MASFLLSSLVLCAALAAHAPILDAGAAEPPAPPLPAAALTAKLDAALTQTSPRGFGGGVLVTREGETLYRRVQGLPGRAGPAPTPASQYLAGSISKQMTAALLARQAARGKIDVAAPLSAYLPDLRDDWAKEVSVGQLLNHTSGIETLGRPLLRPAGERFAYSNFGYLLLGRILERVEGRPFAQQAAEMFERCGMADTAMPPSGADLPRRLPNLAPGFVERDGRLWPWRGQRNAADNPSGGVVSTLADLARWNDCLHEGKWVSGQAYRAMVTPGTQRSHRWGALGYGHGLQISAFDGLTEFSHSGYVEGYISTLLYYPAHRVSVVVLENTAWDDSRPERGFGPHDRVRELVRDYLLNGGAAVPLVGR